MTKQSPCPALPFLAAPLACSLVALTFGASACTGFINDGPDDNGLAETGDGETGEEVGDGDGDTSVDTSIYSVRQGEVGEGTVVTLEGVVITTPVELEEGLVFVQEPDAGEYSGISLYLWSDVVLATPLAPGDVVNITGEYAEFFGASQIIVKNPDDITVVGTDTLPGPDMVTAADIARTSASAEPWEGVRVQVANAMIAESNDGFGQYVLQGDALVGHAFVGSLPKAYTGGSFASITGSLHYSFEEFKLQPASATDLVGYQAPPAPDADTSIYDIRQGTVDEGTYVKLEDVIASSGLTWSDTAEASFFVQEADGGPFSGIQVFVSDIAGLTVEPGDQLTVVGGYEDFFDTSQIEIADASGVTKLGSGPAPAPALIADPATIATGGAAAEEYESVLVQVENVTVTNENPDAPEDYGVFVVTGELRVDDVFIALSDWTKPLLGDAFTSITGVLVYGFETTTLAPRDGADLVSN